MPYTVADVDRHIKGLGAKQKRAWVHIANGVLEHCTGDEKTCAASAIRQANGAAQRIGEALAILDGADIAPDRIIEVAEAILRRTASDDGVRQALTTALRDEYASRATAEAYAGYPWIRDVFHSSDTTGQVVWEFGGKCYQAEFTVSVDASGAYSATIGDELEVDVAYVPMSDAREGAGASILSNEFSELVEAAVKPDGTTRVKIIKPGWGSSGYYKEEALKQDGPNVFRRGLKMYWNHPTARDAKERPERDLNDLAAELTEDAKYDPKGPKGPGLYASAKVFTRYRKAVDELASHIGVSIRGVGITEDGEAEGRKGKIVTRLGPMHSIDFVTVAGAGGEVMSLFESARTATLEDLAAKPPAEPVEEGVASMGLTAEERADIVRELTEAIKPIVTAQSAEVTTALARINEASRLQEARAIAAAELRVMRLPDQTKARIVEAISMNPPIKDGAIDREAYSAAIKEAAKVEAQYIASVSGGRAGVYGMGGADDLLTEADPFHEFTESDEKYGEALGGLFGAMGLSEAGVKSAVAGHRN